MELGLDEGGQSTCDEEGMSYGKQASREQCSAGGTCLGEKYEQPCHRTA